MKNAVQTILMVVLVMAISNKSHAAYTIYMKIMKTNTAQINGESTVRGYENDVVINAESQSSTLPFSVGTGGGVGKISIGDFSFQTNLSSVSIPLMTIMFQGMHLYSVDLYYVNTGCNCAFYKVHMENVYITTIAEATGDESISQQITLSPLQIAWAYYKQTNTGVIPSIPTNQFAWNRSTNSTWSYGF